MGTTEGQATVLVAMTLVCMLEMSSSDEQVQQGVTSRCSTTNSNFMNKSGRNKGARAPDGHILGSAHSYTCICVWTQYLSIQ